MENGFRILRKNDFQPRIGNLAKLSRKCENNNIFRHAKSQKGDGCAADMVIIQAKLEQVGGSTKRLSQEGEININ